MRHSTGEGGTARKAHRGPRFSSSFGGGFKNPRLATALFLALLAPALGGSTTPLPAAIILICIGLAALALPTSLCLSLTEGFLAAAFLAVAASGLLLPASLFHLPWREQLAHEGFPLPWCVSPQPWISLRAWLTLLGGLVWLGWIRGQRWAPQDRRWLAEALALGLAALALFSLLAWNFDFILPAWNANRGFGPFPNRNQTATLFAIGAFLTLFCGIDRLRHLKRNTWLPGGSARFGWSLALWFGLLIIYMAALAVNFSRSGPLLFAGLSAAWLLIGPTWKSRSRVLVISASVLLLFASVFLVAGGALAGGDLVARFGNESLNDFRLKIFADTLALVKASPWTGTGLGCFAEIFPLYRHASVMQERIVHPESDWLWLAAETGLPSLLAAGLLVAQGVARPEMRSAQSPARPLRWGLALASLGFVLHSMIDVPAHRLGTMIPALLIFGLATGRGENDAPTPAPAYALWLSRLTALAVLSSGLLFTWALLAHHPLPLAEGATLLTQEADEQMGAENHQAALLILDRALEWAPLDWRVHFTRAVAEIKLGQFTNALRDFRQARFLEPNFAGLPFDEGHEWAQVSPLFALDAFQEAMRRMPPSGKASLFQNILVEEYGHPELRDALWKMADGVPAFELPYLNAATREDASARLAGILHEDSALHAFDTAARQRLFAVWLEKGDAANLANLLQSHPDWLKSGWHTLAEYEASHGDFRTATDLYLRYVPRPTIPAGLAIADARHRFNLDPVDLAAALAIYRDEISQNHPEEAAAALYHISNEKDCPGYVLYLKAELLARQGKAEEAWKFFARYPVDSR